MVNIPGLVFFLNILKYHKEIYFLSIILISGKNEFIISGVKKLVN